VRVSVALPNSPCVLATPMLPILAIGPRGMQKMFARISDGGLVRFTCGMPESWIGSRHASV
jgi:hypothetical protein